MILIWLTKFIFRIKQQLFYSFPYLLYLVYMDLLEKKSRVKFPFLTACCAQVRLLKLKFFTHDLVIKIKSCPPTS